MPAVRPLPASLRSHYAWRIGTSALRIHVLYVAAAFLLQRHLVFPRALIPDGPRAPTRTQKIWLDVNGNDVEAWLLTRSSTASRPALLFAHGNGLLIDHAARLVQAAVLDGYVVLLVEYPGYGRSGGSPSRAEILAAFEAGYDWLTSREDVDRTNVTFMGHSLEGAVVCDLTARRPSHRLVLVSTFTDLASMFRRFLLPNLVVRDPFDCAYALQSYRGSVLILHGVDDDVIGFEHGQALAKAAPRARFEALPCRHNDCFEDRAGLWTRVLPSRPSEGRPSTDGDASDRRTSSPP